MALNSDIIKGTQTMKLKTVLIALAIAAMTVASVPASWANSLTFQGVMFNLTATDSNTLQLNILNARSTTSPDWADAAFLKNIGLKDIGSVGGAVLGGWSVSALELNANGCGGGDSGGFCFTSTTSANGVRVTDNMNFTIDFTRGSLNLDAPHLKVRFLDTTGTKEGSLLSQTIPGTSVSEPASLLLLGAGLAGIGLWSRKVGKG